MGISREESMEKFEQALTIYVKEYMAWYGVEQDEDTFEDMMDKISRMVEDVIDECTDGGGYDD